VELIAEAEQAFAAARRLVDEQSAIVQRLERTGGCNSEAVDLLNNLRELLAARERRLARVRGWPSALWAINGLMRCSIFVTPRAGSLSHGDQAPPPASRGDLHAKGNNRKHRPTAMEKNSRGYHQAARDRANGRSLQNIGEGS